MIIYPYPCITLFGRVFFVQAYKENDFANLSEKDGVTYKVEFARNQVTNQVKDTSNILATQKFLLDNLSEIKALIIEIL